MNIALTPAEEANLAAHARTRGTTAESVVREAIAPILKSAPAKPESSNNQDQQVPAKRHISQVLADRMKALPDEVFEGLPIDGASEHDHYLYGAPKRNR